MKIGYLKPKKSKRKRRLPSNWRDRVELDKVVGKYSWEYFLSFRKGKTPKGFSRHIGYIRVDLKSPHYIEEAEVDDYFQRRGLGTMLYTAALKDFGKLSTSFYGCSSQARHLWRKLVKIFPHETKFWEPRLTIFISKIAVISSILPFLSCRH